MTEAVETTVYTQDPPWEGLGTYVGDEQMDSRTAIIKAGLNWEVEKQDIYASQDQIHSQVIPSHKAVVRTSDQHILGVVGNRYHPIQNLEAFDFMDSLVDSGQMKYHTAGSMRDGQKIWLLGKVGDIEVIPQDKLDHYLFLYNAHDGSSSLRVVFTTIRVICANMAPAILRQTKGEGVQIRHTKNLKDKIEQARDILGFGVQKFDEFNAWAKGAVNTQLTANQWDTMLQKIVPDVPPHLATKKVETMRQNVRNDISELYYDGTGQDIPGVAGTGWAAYNAVVEYANYHRKARGGNQQERRFESSVLGDSSRLIKRAVAEISKAA